MALPGAAWPVAGWLVTSAGSTGPGSPAERRLELGLRGGEGPSRARPAWPGVEGRTGAAEDEAGQACGSFRGAAVAGKDGQQPTPAVGSLGADCEKTGFMGSQHRCATFAHVQRENKALQCRVLYGSG